MAMGQAPWGHSACSRVQVCHVATPEECCCVHASAGESSKVEHQLLGAIVNGDTGKAQDLISAGSSDILNCRLQVPLSDGTYMCYSDGATPLHLACLLGHTDLAASLIERRAFVEAADARGNTALTYAERGQHQDIQRLLLEHSGPVSGLIPSVSPEVAASGLPVERRNPEFEGWH
eukprot:TRINITY_DN45125_c0_g1_i1.p1 TRINITY_DN45125_c0_g1~~TRINITY_DN45125_c0_g1_i1.p1  ORF type:complete len:176 (+),score=20.21 TRINITY_DN45125_c0_g1_i1:55-582(+)